MRIKNKSLALALLGMIITVLTACAIDRSAHPQSGVTGSSSPVSTPTERQGSNQPIRSVDFANFTFSWLPELGDANKTFTLRNGDLEPTRGKNGMVEDMGVSLQSLAYGDVTDDGKEEAMAVLSIITGGSATPHATYVYELTEGKPKLLWAFSSGDRAASGLRRVYADKGELVIERYSSVNAKGDCCPTLFTRVRYQWQDNHFEQRGEAETLPNPENEASLLMEPYRSSN